MSRTRTRTPRTTGTPVTTATAPELQGMPPEDPVAQIARRFLNAKAEIETAKEAAEVAGGELLVALRDQNRDSILVDGAKLSIKHKEEEDRIVIKRPKTS